MDRVGPASVIAIQDRVLRAVKHVLDENGVDMPYPTQVVLFHDQTEETDGDRTRQREGWPVPSAGEAPAPARIGMALEGAEASGGDDRETSRRA